MELSSDSFLNQPPEASMRQRAAKAVVFSQKQQQAQDSQQQIRPPSASAKGHKPSAKQRASAGYKDWTVREETAARQNKKSAAKPPSQSAGSTQKMGASSSSKNNTQKGSRRSSAAATRSRKSKSRSGSRPRSISTETADVIKRRVQLQYNNYMQTKEALDEEISLLEDSQATPPRPVKQQIMEEQKAKRKRDEKAKQAHEQKELKRKSDAVDALQLRFKAQVASFKKELDAEKRSQERVDKAKKKTKKREQEDSNYRAQTEEPSAQAFASPTYKVGKQVSELRRWIENAIKEEHLASTPSMHTDPSAQNLEIPGVGLGNKPKKKVSSKSKTKSTGGAAAEPTKKQSVNTSAFTNPSLDEFASKETGKVKMLKHQLPGNSVLAEQEQGRLGSRQDRYGVFSAPGGSDFDKVVSAQRAKVLQVDGQAKQQVWNPSHTEAKQVKQVLGEALKGLGARTDMKVQDDESARSSSATPSEVESDIDEEESGRQTPQSDGSSDKIPVKQSPADRSYRPMINQEAEDLEDAEMDSKTLPGVVNTQAHFVKLEKQKREKEAGAALVIQKFYRGHAGRKHYKRQQTKEKQRVEFEYEQLNRELKSDTQYNLKTYLAEKKKIREKAGLADSISADEIAEVIGESSSVSQVVRQRQSGAVTAQLQNFFKPESKTTAFGKDPLSLISIFAKRNGVIPSQEKSRTLRPERSSSRDRSQRTRNARKGVPQKAHVSTDSAIEEEYSHDFSDSLPKEQSIIEEDMPKHTTSGASASNKLKAGRLGAGRKDGHISGSHRKFNKDETDSIATEVIDEESFQQSKANDSIEEDSIANEVSSEAELKKKKSTESIAEESVIREEYEDDNFASYNASQSVAARNRVKFGMHGAAAQQPLTEVEKQKQSDQLKLAEEQEQSRLQKNRMIGDLMNEMREYEKASMSNVLVDRMEKIVVSSLAQKDQIIMAQRLAELEAEKRHKEEINKIREEQIKLMSQLMLLGPAGAPAADAGMSKQHREELLVSIQKIIEKPIQIKNETVHVNYSVSKGLDDQLLASADKFGASVSAARKSYLEEYDESRRLEKQGPVVTQSQSRYADMVEEDIQLRLGRNALETSQSKRLGHDDSIDDLVGEAASAIEESIKDEVGESQGRVTTSKMSRQSRENSANKTNKRAEGKQDSVLAEVERAIDSERSEREEQLARDLKKRRISPRSYDRGIKDIEKWVIKEKKELWQRRRKLEENQKEVQKYIEKFRKDKHSVPMLTKIASPRADSARRSYMDDSQNSDQVQAAIRQTYLLEKDLSGMSPEQKYTMKKREAAQTLLDQKEKAIQKALQEKMSKYQGTQAEDLLQHALELDIEAEVERRFDQARREIEESRNLESARSMQSHEKTGRTKKSVQFAKSVGSHSTKPTAVSTERIRADNRHLDEDSISESIQIAESISQSLRSHSVAEVTKSRSAQKLQSVPEHSQEKFSPQKARKQPSGGEDSDQESIIESEYSQEFTESMNSKDVSESHTASKRRLQAKAKDIEESAAYSENFEEDSLAKSATVGKDESASKEKMLKMDTVKEESVDDSAAEVSKDVSQSMGSEARSSKATPASKAEQRVDSSMGSLPSDDLSVKDSVRSVDWKFDVRQDSARSAADPSIQQQEQSEVSEKHTSYIREEKVEDSEGSDEEEVQSSSDLNTRDEIADLESCPEGVGQSGSQSAEVDLLANADLITDELLELILTDYKEAGDYDLNTAQDQPDEEDYKEKFPWTLDKKPEPKPSPKPAGVKVGAQPRPPKSVREIRDEEFKTKHDENMALLKGREEQVIDFLEFMCKRTDLRELMEALNKPIERDPMKILSQIVNCYDEEDSVDKINDDTLMHAQQQILQQGFFNRIDREYVMMARMKSNKAAVEDSDQLTVSQEEMENINNVHHYALFESLNEALDVARPYQNKGEPMPWSKSTRTVKKIETEAQARGVLDKAREQVVKWMRMRAGTNFAPLPEAPQPTQDEMGEEILPPPLEEGEEERRNMHRQEKLAELMTDDIIENDSLWVDYEIQDTQTRFDVADMILHHLAGEIAEFLAEKAK